MQGGRNAFYAEELRDAGADATLPETLAAAPLANKPARNLDVPHDRYVLAPLGGPDQAHLARIFRNPVAVIPDHNLIFTSPARSLILG